MEHTTEHSKRGRGDPGVEHHSPGVALVGTGLSVGSTHLGMLGKWRHGRGWF